MASTLSEHYTPPRDGYAGTLVGRAFLPGERGGPAVVLVREDGVAAMIATHNLDIARRMDRAVTIRDGVLEAA